MITRILVPTDFSAAADNALRYALRFAKKTGAEVHLLHVVSIPVADTYFVAGAYMNLMAGLETGALESFEKLKKRFYKTPGIKFRSAIATGDLQSEIRSYARKEKIDLVVMGTTGASGVQEILFGSNAASTAAGSDVPLLVIPKEAKYRSLKHVVYATDFNEPEFPAVSRLIYLAALYDAKVTVLHVKSEHDRYFNSERNFFARNKKNISYRNWEIVKADDKNVMDGIANFVGESGADMLVLARHNRPFFDRIFHRSMSKRMAYHTDIPLLILSKTNK